ncbi:two-component system sensor histidine kinase CreC [Zophobihabitans entericus]|uniref:histidine kinase n=1 Tax=Zophobihabitans entericus TaxID=1635327 RepID=A0A6G9ICR6_9GAMM|nr:two-component system sensor histidine kinase CreC [Zophobihabitans entericus]QIQ21609.1 two-component system sensor histidine kinase CreC [Zophobihabitans entericus]
MRIGLRLLIGYLLIVAIASYFILSIFLKEITPSVRRATEGMLVDTANLLAHIVTQDRDDLSQFNESDFYRAFEEVNKYPIGANIDGIVKNRVAYRVYITNKQGIVIFDSTGMDVGKDYSRWNDVYLTLRGRYGARSTLSNPADKTSSVMYVAAPLRIKGEIAGVLTVSKPNKDMAVIVERSERRILYFGLILIILALGVGGVFIWWINRSISRLVNYAEKVSNHEEVLLPKLDSPELTTLGLSLENMRLKLEGKDYVEKYVHTLTHELKSPLAAIRGATEILQDSHDINETERRFLNNIDEQSERLQQLIDKMLQQARLESRVGVDLQSTDLSSLLSQVVENKQIQAIAKQVTLKLAKSESQKLVLDRFLITQAMSNLLDNALDFTPEGGEINVSGEVADKQYIITVSDTGSGIPEFAKEKVFERFYSLPRANKSKSTGLGLSFVKEVVMLHHGNIRIQSQEDKGTVATLILPI